MSPPRANPPRYVVGWMVARNEAVWLARIFIEESCRRLRIDSSELILPADRGSAMISKSVPLLTPDDVHHGLAEQRVSRYPLNLRGYNDTRGLVETIDVQSNTIKIIALNTEDSALNSDDPLSHFH